MTAHRQGEITKRAHAIWEREGRPEGKATEHWQRAEAEIAAESTPKATRAEASPQVVGAAPKATAPKAAAAKAAAPKAAAPRAAGAKPKRA